MQYVMDTLFPAFLLKLSYKKYHICSRTPLSNATLIFWANVSPKIGTLGSRIRLNILPIIFSREIPMWLSHSLLSPLLYLVV